MTIKRKIRHNRWFQVFIATSLLAVSAIFIGLTVGKKPSELRKLAPLSFKAKLRASTVLVRAGHMVGSGVFYRDNYIISAAHVCEEAQGDVDAMRVELYQGGVTSVKRIVIPPPESESDVCLIELNENLNLYLPKTKLAPDSWFAEGSYIYVAGFPGGQYYTFRLGRIMSEDVIRIYDEFGIPRFVRTYVANVKVTPGMSGGPVVNQKGELVGTAVWQNLQGLDEGGLSTLEQITALLESEGIR